MQRRDHDCLALSGEKVEDLACIRCSVRKKLDFAVGAQFLDIRRDPHPARKSRSDEQNVGIVRDEGGDIGCLEQVPFLPPPGCDSSGTNDHVLAEGLPVYCDRAE